jgi:regulator of replication initiation timing
MIREEEELGEGLMKAFKDQKVLYNFYKVIQLDSQLGECYRTIGHIKEKLRNMSAVKEVVRFE